MTSEKIKNRRREDGFVSQKPEFIRVQFTLGKGTNKKKVYSLNVLDSSKHGLGLLITEKDLNLLQILKKGQKLQKMRFFTTDALIEVDGIVVHKTKIERGEYKGAYIIGIATEDVTTSVDALKKIPDKVKKKFEGFKAKTKQDVSVKKSVAESVETNEKLFDSGKKSDENHIIISQESRKDNAASTPEMVRIQSRETLKKGSKIFKLAMLSLLSGILIFFFISYFSILNISDSKSFSTLIEKETTQKPIPEKFLEKKLITNTYSIGGKKAQNTYSKKPGGQEKFSKPVPPSQPNKIDEPIASPRPNKAARKEENTAAIEPARQIPIQELENQENLPNSMMQLRQKDAIELLKLIHKERKLSYPYSIYLGSYKNLHRAQRALSIYQKKGLSPYWVKLDLGSKGLWFRVFAGYYQKREDADAFIKENNLPDAKPRRTKYANFIGVYESEKELETKRRLLLALGYCPYIIQENKDKSFLYTGAFYQKVRAEKEHKELASNGIQSQLVER